MIKIFTFLLIIIPFYVSATPAYYWVEFTDKSQSEFSIYQPEDYLSERALNRRKKQNIEITVQDLPVNATYLNKLKKEQAKIHHTSKWFNAATVLCTAKTAQKLEKLPFVKSIHLVGKPYDYKVQLSPKNTFPTTAENLEMPDQKYGFAKTQIEAMNGEKLHEMGYTGEGILIAVIDAGFYGLMDMPVLDHLSFGKNLKTAHDFVDGDNYNMQASLHGTAVLSLMAAKKDNLMVGSAPDATYVCLRTEDVRGESRLEECNWIAALEYADSMGVDVVNGSIGYTRFEVEGMNYETEHLDGKTSLATQAAEMAFTKGMIIVCAAGNEGNNDWKYVSMPADGPNVLAVGAVDYAQQRLEFSSKGSSAQSNFKPDVVAPGNLTVGSLDQHGITKAQGTSFSSPLVAGLVAALWQANPRATNQEILNAVRNSGHNKLNPNREIGYGVPDFLTAHAQLNEEVWTLRKSNATIR